MFTSAGNMRVRLFIYWSTYLFVCLFVLQGKLNMFILKYFWPVCLVTSRLVFSCIFIIPVRCPVIAEVARIGQKKNIHENKFTDLKHT